MHRPPLVRRRCETPRVENALVFAQVRQEAQLFGEGVDAVETALFFTHKRSVCEKQRRSKARLNGT